MKVNRCFNCIDINSWNIFQNIIFCAPQKKESNRFGMTWTDDRIFIFGCTLLLSLKNRCLCNNRKTVFLCCFACVPVTDTTKPTQLHHRVPFITHNKHRSRVNVCFCVHEEAQIFKVIKQLETPIQMNSCKLILVTFTGLDYNLIHTLMSISVARNRISRHESSPLLWIHNVWEAC